MREKTEALHINEIQLLLAMKRTSLATLRTGILVAALPVIVAAFLIVFSKYYVAAEMALALAVLGALCLIFFGLGIYMVARSMAKIQIFDAQIEKIARRDRDIRYLVDTWKEIRKFRHGRSAARKRMHLPWLKA
jgi:ABC-type multidrug transport system fused ATPase/permease subunit